MDKLTSLKIRYPDGTYSNQILISVLADNVQVNSTTTLTAALSLLDARIDQIISPSQSTLTLDEEVRDIRIGKDATRTTTVTYQNAGIAVRTQLDEMRASLDDDITEIRNTLYITPELIDNFYLNWYDGTLKENSVSCCSNFIKISPNIIGTSFTYCGRVNDGDGASLVFYDQNKDPISPYYRAWDNNPVTVVVPNGAEYFKLSCRKSLKSYAYVKYDVDTVNKETYKTFVDIYNKLNILYDYPKMIDNLYLSWSDGQVHESSNSCASDYIELSPNRGDSYLIYCGQVNDGNGASLVFYDQNKDPITPYYRAWDNNPTSSIIPTQAKYYRLSCKNSSKPLVYVKYMVEDPIKDLYEAKSILENSIEDLYKEFSDLTIEENSIWG